EQQREGIQLLLKEAGPRRQHAFALSLEPDQTGALSLQSSTGYRFLTSEAALPRMRHLLLVGHQAPERVGLLFGTINIPEKYLAEGFSREVSLRDKISHLPTSLLDLPPQVHLVERTDLPGFWFEEPGTKLVPLSHVESGAVSFRVPGATSRSYFEVLFAE